MDVEVQHTRTYHVSFSEHEMDRIKKMVEVYDQAELLDNPIDAGKGFEDGIELMRVLVSRAGAHPMKEVTVRIGPDGMTGTNLPPSPVTDSSVRARVQADNSGLVGPWVERE